MALDKILQKIQLQIDELTPSLELFLDETIQPSVQDCEKLQKHLSDIQENLAVYKYNKQNKELSPSFNIHAKVSEKQAETEKTTEISKEIKEAIKIEREELKEVTTPSFGLKKTEHSKPKPSLSVGINDKFRFINELFSQNSSEYNIAIEQLNTVNNWSEAEIYLNSLKSVYEWKDNAEVVKYFYSLVKKRFD